MDLTHLENFDLFRRRYFFHPEMQSLKKHSDSKRWRHFKSPIDVSPLATIHYSLKWNIVFCQAPKMNPNWKAFVKKEVAWYPTFAPPNQPPWVRFWRITAGKHSNLKLFHVRSVLNWTLEKRKIKNMKFKNDLRVLESVTNILVFTCFYHPLCHLELNFVHRNHCLLFVHV